MSFWRRVGALIMVVAALGGTIWASIRFGWQIGDVNALWGVIGAVVAFLTLAARMVYRKHEPADAEKERAVLDQLADAIEKQWREEAYVRGIVKPLPLPVEWRSADSRISDRMSNIFPAVVHGREPEQIRSTYLTGILPNVVEAFKRLPARRLVIIGQPGSGKTVLTLFLTLELLEQRDKGDPVPVLFPAASWNPGQQNLQVWMTTWLEESYTWLKASGKDAGNTLAASLVRAGQIIPVLDGLDEMASALQPQALRELNRALTTSRTSMPAPLVLTCRLDEYTNLVASSALAVSEDPSKDQPLSEALDRAAVVELRPLRAGAVADYLVAATPEVQAGKWSPVVEVLKADRTTPLSQALSTPLMVAMARVTYSATTGDPTRLLASSLNDRAAVEAYLLDRFMAAVYPESPESANGYARNVPRSERWLRFLAAHLKLRGTHDITWWEMSRILPRKLYWALFGITTGIVGAVSFGMLVSAPVATMVGLVIAVTAPLLAPLIEVSRPFSVEIRALPTVVRFATGMLVGLAVGVVLELLLGIPPAQAVRTGLLVGLFGGLACALEFVLEQPTDTARVVSPRTSLESDRTAFLVRVLGVGPLGGVALALAIAFHSGTGVERGTRVGIVVALAVGLGAGVVVSLRTNVLQGLVFGLGLGGLSGSVCGSVLAASEVPDTELAVVCGVWLWAEITLALAFTSAWGSYMIGRAAPALFTRLPWSLIAFLEDARSRGVLRQNGATFQFRHVLLRDRLAVPSVDASRSGAPPPTWYDRIRRSGRR